MKHWSNECKDKVLNNRINKIIVKTCLNYCIECWNNRNKKLHKLIKKRQCAIEWIREIEEMILKSNRIDAIRNVRNYSIRVEDTSANQI